MFEVVIFMTAYSSLLYHKCVATLPCEVFVLKNRNDPLLSEVSFHARLSHSKQLLRYIHPMMLSFLFTDEKMFTVTIQKNLQNDQLYAHPTTKKKDIITKCLYTQLSFSR